MDLTHSSGKFPTEPGTASCSESLTSDLRYSSLTSLPLRLWGFFPLKPDTQERVNAAQCHSSRGGSVCLYQWPQPQRQSSLSLLPRRTILFLTLRFLQLTAELLPHTDHQRFGCTRGLHCLWKTCGQGLTWGWKDLLKGFSSFIQTFELRLRQKNSRMLYHIRH